MGPSPELVAHHMHVKILNWGFMCGDGKQNIVKMLIKWLINFLMEQELLNQVFGDLISTCESYISNIVLKEDGAEQLQEDLLVSLVPLCGLVKG